MTRPEEETSADATSPSAYAMTSTVGAVSGGDRVSRTLDGLVEARVHQLERARRLSRRLGLQVTIDHTGWARGQIEVMIQRERDGTIHPASVRIAPEVTDQAVLGPDGVRARCEQYNARIRTLYQLADRVAELVRRAKALPAPGSSLAYARHELGRIRELIAKRQAITMGRGTVQLVTLEGEIEWFGRYDAHLGPIVLAAEPPTPAIAAPAGSARPPKRRRWMRW